MAATRSAPSRSGSDEEASSASSGASVAWWESVRAPSENAVMALGCAEACGAAGRSQPKATAASARSGAVGAAGPVAAAGLAADRGAGGKAFRLVLLRRSCPLSCRSCNRLLKGGAVVLEGLGFAPLLKVGSELEERWGGRGGSGAPARGRGGGATGSDPELSLPGAGKRLAGRGWLGTSLPPAARTRKSARQLGQRIFAPDSAMSASGASTDSRQAGQRSFIGGRAESASAVRSRLHRPQVIAPVPKCRRFAPLDTRTKVGEETSGFKLHDQTCRGRLRTRTAWRCAVSLWARFA